MSRIPLTPRNPAPVRLDDDLREQLGLPADERLRLLRVAGRTVMLERWSEEGSVPLPWDRDLMLTIDVGCVSLADVLHLLHGSRKSGFLVFVAGDVEKCVYLQGGEVVFASSNRPTDRLGECLLRAGMITLTQLIELEESFVPSQRFGKMMVERGILSSQQLWHGVKLQVAEIVRSLFAHTTGVVHFWEGDVQPDNVVRLALPTQTLIAEGLAQRDELLRFVALLESPGTFLVRSGAAVDVSANGRLVHDLLDEPSSFDDVRLRAGLDTLSAARTVQVLQMLGAADLRQMGEDDQLRAVPLGAGDEAGGLRHLVIDHLSLLEELLAPLVAVDGPNAVRERMRAILEDVAADGADLMFGVELGPVGVPDPEEVIRRALRLPGNREQWVSRALGELLAYAEFDLRNHPRLEQPERFLDLLEDRRAKLVR